MSKKITNIALWIVICLLVLAVAYAISPVGWIYSIITVLLFVGFVLLKHDKLKKKDSE